MSNAFRFRSRQACAPDDAKSFHITIAVSFDTAQKITRWAGVMGVNQSTLIRRCIEKHMYELGET